MTQSNPSQAEQIKQDDENGIPAEGPPEASAARPSNSLLKRQRMLPAGAIAFATGPFPAVRALAIVNDSRDNDLSEADLNRLSIRTAAGLKIPGSGGQMVPAGPVGSQGRVQRTPIPSCGEKVWYAGQLERINRH